MKSNQFKMLSIAGLLLAAGVFSNQAMAAETATASASAEIKTPIAVTKTADLNFGSIVVPAGSATVVVAPNGGRSATGVTLITDTGNAPSAAAFTVTGESAATYSLAITFAANTITGITSVDTWTSSLTGGTSPNFTGNLTGGSEAVTVGATLTLDQTVTSGVKDLGTITATVAYN